MNIRPAEPQDLERIMEIYARARSFMAAHGNPRQWGASNWPPKELIQEDIRQGDCYVCMEKEKIAGVFYYAYGTDAEPCYKEIKGSWQGENTYGVVHRIASDGTVKGIGSFCIGWAFERCKNLRMDTHSDNIVMQNLLAKLHFTQRGFVSAAEDRDPRLAYEKLF